jgi:hypothetical protein
VPTQSRVTLSRDQLANEITTRAQTLSR